MAEGSPQLDRARRLSELLVDSHSWTRLQTLLFLKQLAIEVRSWHERGRLHRAIVPQRVSIDEQGQLRLESANGPCHFGATAFDAELCPPELAQAQSLEVPEDLEAAVAALADVQPGMDPRRIDAYQLGALCWRLLSGLSTQAYMFDPKAKAVVPAVLMAVLDRMLGYDTLNRLASCDPLIEALDEVLRGEQAIAATPPSGTARDHHVDTPSQGSWAATPAEDNSPTLARPSASSSDAPLPFAKLGHFRIVRRIGRGGMGEVYEGFDESLDRRVAIKVLPVELAKDQEFVARFHAEASAAGKINHPNVITVHAIGEDAGHYFFAMPYVEGQSLGERLARERRLSAGDAMEIVRQCLGGLGAAHALGLIHRDIKPANILLEAGTGRAVLVDFGLVRCQSRKTEMTATGIILGTVDYIAPEQARGNRVDHRADLYSLGVVLYRMLAGRLPFESDSPTAMMFQHAYEQPFPLQEAAPDVPGPVAEMVARLMAKDPADRYQDCAGALADVRAWQEGRPLAALPAAAADRRSAEDLEDVPPLPPLPTHPEKGRRGRAVRDLVATLFRRHAPEFLQEMQGTMFQVDAALASHRRRRDRLAALLTEARAVGVAEHVDRLEVQLAKADASLAQLRSQREVLVARLRAAEAQQGRPSMQRRSRRQLALALSAATVVLFASVVFYIPRLGSRPVKGPVAMPVASPKVTTTAAPRVSQPIGPPRADLTNSIGMELVFILPGEFEMGSTPDEVQRAMEYARRNNMTDKRYFERVPTEAPRHHVRITKPFYLAMYPVTQGEYETVMGVNPSTFTESPVEPSSASTLLPDDVVTARRDERRTAVGKDSNRHPVETVSWDEAMEFCHKLSAMPAERAARRVYRLPTEAEWEYTCRAGTTTPWCYGDDEAGLGEFAWFTKNSKKMTHPVGMKQPNAWGLYDTQGNVYQWCADWFGENYYEHSLTCDPAGPAVGTTRVLRGGAWNSHPFSCRAAFRHHEGPDRRIHACGFRVAYTIPEPLQAAVAAPSPAVALPVPDKLQGRFHAVVKGELQLLCNGKTIVVGPGVSADVVLAQGDVVVVRVYSTFVYRAFRLAFISADGKWVVPFKRADFREVSGPPQAITAAEVNKATQHPGLGRPDPYSQHQWLDKGLHADEVEWMWGAKRGQWYQYACVVDRQMFKAIAPNVATAAAAAQRYVGRKALFIVPGGEARQELFAAEEAARGVGWQWDTSESLDAGKVDYSAYHTILVGSGGMDYWQRQDNPRDPAAFRHVAGFVAGGGHLIVFGGYNSRDREHLQWFGIRTSAAHSDGFFFQPVGEATSLLFEGSQLLIPTNVHPSLNGSFTISVPHTVLLAHGIGASQGAPALATLRYGDGRVTITMAEPYHRGDDWLITVVLRWAARGCPTSVAPLKPAGS
jgi:formylglycine-generating enzyme required for sulfatase activity/serine/threonine protein kinase